MKTRLATEEDIPRIIEMSQQFYVTCSYTSWAPYHVPTATALIKELIQSGILIVVDSINDGVVGMIGMKVHPFIFNATKLQASEVIWWVDLDYRTHTPAAALLMMAMEEEAKSLGVHYLMMLSLATSPPSAGAMYTKLGYENTEHAWSKVICS